MTGAVAAAVIAVIIISCFIGYSSAKKKMDSGQVIRRDPDFVKKAEIFTLNGEWDKVRKELQSADYHGVAKCVCSGKSATIGFNGVGWKAEIYKVKTEKGEKDTYYFHFTEWTTHRGINQNIMDMNTLLTSVEKALLAVDPKTQVSVKDTNVKSKPSFF